MTFAFARIGGVAAVRLGDYYPEGERWWLRLHEKGGKRHRMLLAAFGKAKELAGSYSPRGTAEP
jgi:hypothetical protein